MLLSVKRASRAAPPRDAASCCPSLCAGAAWRAATTPRPAPGGSALLRLLPPPQRELPAWSRRGGGVQRDRARVGVRPTVWRPAVRSTATATHHGWCGVVLIRTMASASSSSSALPRRHGGTGKRKRARGKERAELSPEASPQSMVAAIGQVERHKDVVALRVETFVQDPTVRQEARARLLAQALAAERSYASGGAKDDAPSGRSGEFKRRERIVELMREERELDAALALFEAHITSDDSIQGMPSHVISLLANPTLSMHGLPPYEGKEEERPNDTPWTTFTRVATDLRHPHTWYPLARATPGGRRVVLHVGPTNSGKTHKALTRLKEAKSGVYCGPLRLLAEEVFRRMNASGVSCSLLTGQRVVTDPSAQHLACTVEMADIAKPVECAVVDEIQMIGDRDRGWAWTRALLGLPATEIHLCGNESVLPLVQRICQDTGEKLQVFQYERLTPLAVSERALGRRWYDSLKPGDCVVAFSRADIHALKREIERNTKFRCCVVYGNLPPETRVEQAALFNDPESNYDVLVASDAIGMGLNLNISRVVFSTLWKFDGIERRILSESEIKQIAGRAGRYRSLFPVGEVTAFDKSDLPILRKALRFELEPLQSAGLAPTFEQVSMYYRGQPQRAFHRVLSELTRKAAVSDHYFLCGNEEQVSVAKLIESLPLTLRERYKFSIAPVRSDDSALMWHLLKLAHSHATDGEVPMDLQLDVSKGNQSSQLAELEQYHQMLDMYLWLSYRFDSFTERDRAVLLKKEVEERIKLLLVRQTKRSKRKAVGQGSKHEPEPEDESGPSLLSLAAPILGSEESIHPNTLAQCNTSVVVPGPGQGKTKKKMKRRRSDS